MSVASRIMESPITVRAAIMQALVSKPAYGLDIIERVEKQTKGKVILGQGSVYPALRDLEREGLIESYEGEPTPERGGRPRRYYKLTALGAQAVTEQQTIVSEIYGLIPGVA